MAFVDSFSSSTDSFSVGVFLLLFCAITGYEAIIKNMKKGIKIFMLLLLRLKGNGVYLKLQLLLRKSKQRTPNELLNTPAPESETGQKKYKMYYETGLCWMIIKNYKTQACNFSTKTSP